MCEMERKLRMVKASVPKKIDKRLNAAKRKLFFAHLSETAMLRRRLGSLVSAPVIISGGRASPEGNDA